MIVRYNMVVDFVRPTKSNTVVIAENDANSRLLHFTLLNDKAKFDMSDVENIILRGLTTSGATILDGEVTILEDEDGNKINEIEYLIPLAISQTTGTLTVTLTLYGVDGEVLTSFEMYIKTRNALYNEDDMATEEDVSGFRDLLRRTESALAKLESMVQHNELPNPEALVIDLDGGQISYQGYDQEYLPLGHLARIGKDLGEIEETVDDSAAAQAINAANRAEESAERAENSAILVGEAGIEGKLEECARYAESALNSANDAKKYFDNIDNVVPSFRAEKVDKTATLIVKDATGTTTVNVLDGLDGKDGKDGVDGVNGYLYIRYSADSTGADMQTDPSASMKYIGFYAGDSETAPTNPADYKWSKYVGEGSGGGGTGTTDYTQLDNKPKINSVTINGNVSLEDLGISKVTDTYSATSSDGMSGKAVASALKAETDKLKQVAFTGSYNDLTDKPTAGIESVDSDQFTVDTNKKLSLSTAVTNKLPNQILGVCSGNTALFSNATYIGGAKDYLLDVYCSDSQRYIKSQTVSGNVLTVEFDDDVSSAVCVCVALEKGV